MTRALLTACLALALFPAACDRQPGGDPAPRTTPAANAAMSGEARQIDALETRIRLEQAEKRIADLERQVGELRDNPQTLDLDLLRKRLEAVEARVYATPPADTPRNAGATGNTTSRSGD